MVMRGFFLLGMFMVGFTWAEAFAQTDSGELIDKVYGVPPKRPDSYSFTHVIHYDLVHRMAGVMGQPTQKTEGAMDLFYTPGDSAYARKLAADDVVLFHIGDLSLGMRYILSDLAGVKIGNESALSEHMNDTLILSRVSGDREIEGRMSAHYWHEQGTQIDELWADPEASAEEVAIGRLWPRFEPGFESLAIGTYSGLATRWISIDTEFGRDPRVVLEFKGTETLEEPIEISFEGFQFPVSEGEMMRRRLEAERQ